MALEAPVPSSTAATRRNWLGLALVVALLLLVALLTASAVRRYFDVTEVTLPDVVGLDLEEATRRLRGLDLEVESYPETVVGAVPGQVTSQTPPPATTVRDGRPVSLGVHTPSLAALVPDLLGATRSEAESLLAGINVPLLSVEYVYSSAPVGTVVEQVPAPGSGLEPSSGISLRLSRGQEGQRVTLPDFQGLSLEAALEQLDQLGFERVGALATSLSFDLPGVVTGQRPVPGEAVAPATEIILLYALPGDRVVRVPDLAGVPLQRAQLLLAAARLQIAQVRFVEDAEKPLGVVSVQPSEYTLAGSPVILEVNGPAEALPDLPVGAVEIPGDVPPVDGIASPQDQNDLPATEGRRVPFSFDPTRIGVRSLMEQPYEFRLVVIDAEGERIVLDQTMEPGQPVSTTVTVYGEALIQTFINDGLFQAWSP